MSVLDAIWLFAGLAVVCKLIERWKHLNSEHRRLKEIEHADGLRRLNAQKEFCEAYDKAEAEGYLFPREVAMGWTSGLGMGGLWAAKRDDCKPRKREVLLLEYKPRD